MLKDLFLTPGRILTKLIFKEKRKSYRSARVRPADGPAVILAALLCWAALAGCLVYSLDKAGFLKQALDVGLEATTGGEARPEPPPEPDSEPRQPNATGTLTRDGSNTERNINPAPAPETAGSGQTVPGAEPPQAWLVILHSIPKDGGLKEAENRKARYRRQGLEVDIMDADAYPLLRDSRGNSYWIVAIGPFDTRDAALNAANKARSFRSGLQVKRGL